MGDVLYGMLFSIIYVLLCTFFINCFSEKKNKTKIKTYIYYFAWTASIMIISLTGLDYVEIRFILIPICSTIFLYILQSLSIVQAIIFSLIFYGLECVADYLMIIIYSYEINEYNVVVAMNSVTSVLLGIASHILLFVIILIISFFCGNNILEVLNKKDWIRLSIFPIFSILAILLLEKNFHNNNDVQNCALMIISFGLLGLNFLVLVIMREIMLREVQIREAQLMYERASNTAQKYLDKAENYERQRKREHEFKNHLTVIYNLICSSEFERAKSYTEELSEQDESYIDIIDMNHPIINSVVNTKYREAVARGIFMSFEVCDISDTNISDNDITIIVSNLLSNAIEACEKESIEKAYIRFKVKKDDNYLYIVVVNSYSHEPVIKNGTYITTKDDKFMHGFGIRNIVDAVKRNKGEYVIDTKDNKFSFIICIPF